jgi:F-type H+-transporting ATPase subunit delta
MAHGKVASQYAKAFLDALKENEKVRTAIRELRAFSEAVESHPELRHVLTTDLFSDEDRRGVVEDIARRLAVSADTTKLLLVLSAAKRLKWVEGIAHRLNILLLNSVSIVPLDVTASSELVDEEKQKVEQKFEKVLGKKVEATYTVDPNLLGGLKVSAAGRTFDGSISGWLTDIHESLMAST